jgi:beta-1,4-mannosyl-glycoprotein beta-1,4-N-acetylglucosaminyltransferase
MLIDTFMFYNELETLELRLTVLDPYVDRFVLVESELNHRGGTKELFFEKNKERFSQWIHKIIHVIVKADESPTDEDPWVREKYQRECILRGLEGVPDNAIVMVSDVDEIPDLSKIPLHNLPQQVCSIHVWMFEYSLKYLFTGEPWIATVMTTCDLFKQIGPNVLRSNRWRYVAFHYCGWHLSSFGGPERVAFKVNTYAHSKDAHELPWTAETFDRLINSGVHTDGKTMLVVRPDNIPLPAPPDVLTRLGFNFSTKNN